MALAFSCVENSAGTRRVRAPIGPSVAGGIWPTAVVPPDSANGLRL